MLVNPKTAVAWILELVNNSDISGDELGAATDILHQLQDKSGGYQISVRSKTADILEDWGSE
jgi:hypothetical protein